MPEIEIRPAVVSDLSGLVAIDHEYQTPYVWQMDRAFDKGQITINFREIRLPRPVKVDSPISPEALGPEISKKSGLLVAAMHNEIAGFISLKEIVPTGTAWVVDLVVRPRDRRHGIGSALALAGEEWAAHRGLRRMVLEVQSKNFPAIQLAVKLGFEFCGYNDHYYANQDIALFFAKFVK
jgi:ribosomal protein S18 acetylase RimI-like enzyme